MKEKTITIGGNPYRVTALDARTVFELHDEFKRSAPCPVQELTDTAQSLPEPMREAFIKEHLSEAYAQKKARSSLDSKEFNEWMKTHGARRMYARMFTKNHPHLTEQEAFQLSCDAVLEHGEGVFDGLFPGKLPGARDAGRGGAKVPRN